MKNALKALIHGLEEPKKNKHPINPEGFVKTLMTGYDNFERKSRKDGLYFSPSKVSYREGAGSCARFWYYKWTHIDKQWTESFSPYSWAAMDAGTDGHLRIGVLFEASDLEVVDVERRLESQDPPIEGNIDFVVDRLGEEILVEFKTTRDEAFQARVRKNNALDYHVMQLCLYMYMNGTKNGIVLYENRNDFEMKAVPVSLDDNMDNLNATLEWMREVWDAFETNQLPANVFTWTNPKACAECPFQTECFADDASGDVLIERGPKLDWRS